MRRALWLMLCAAVCGPAVAQTYPAKPVRLIVTYPPDGSSDLMARVFGAKLGKAEMDKYARLIKDAGIKAQ